MPIIVVASTKGGVYKTTSAVALAARLAHLDSTLLVDLDSQGQVALHFGLPLRSGVYHWLSGTLPVANCVVSGRPAALDILPGDSMTKALYNAFTGAGGAQQVAEKLAELRDLYPFVIIDTAAGGLLQEAALMAADHVIVPFRPEKPSVDALFASIEVVKQLAPSAHITVLPTGFDGRLSEHRNNLAMLAQHLPPQYACEEMYAIRQRIAVAEAVACGLTLWEYNTQSINDVRIGYEYLAMRVVRLAGYAEGMILS